VYDACVCMNVCIYVCMFTNVAAWLMSEYSCEVGSILRKASAISKAVNPFFSRKETRRLIVEEATLGCDKKLTAALTCSSRIVVACCGACCGACGVCCGAVAVWGAEGVAGGEGGVAILIL